MLEEKLEVELEEVDCREEGCEEGTVRWRMVVDGVASEEREERGGALSRRELSDMM
jgi:hypothetical protein